ncbi:S-adenosyl-L-methionine-dependent methyltransferase [Bisporella sp. PMI_857]|nr:S-adenosyl-L-methionine-dependent methyltransferase [Bisporella sp. PMI_857]
MVDDRQLSDPNYWDQRYKTSDGGAPTHEWFRSFADLEPFFARNLFVVRKAEDDPRILHLGSGDSNVPLELASRGYKHQLCVDFSSTVVELMAARHSAEAGIEWKYMDVREMPGLSDRSIDVAFDKGTLDAMIHGSPWSPPDDVIENTGNYLHEVYRVLKDDGVFLYITFRQPHFMKPLLSRSDEWDFDMQTLSGEGSFDYYGFVLRKKKQ